MSSAPAQLVTEPTPSESAPAAAKGRRLAWLDALRGFAALCVVFDHMSTLVLQHVRSDLYVWFNGGQYGVFVFFLVSGYIIPASLERRGSVRGFWVSRAFRLYPLYIVGIAVSLLAWKTGFGPIHGADTQPRTWVYSLPFMMSNMIDGANVPNVIWTLSFEMVFYLLLSALFTFRVHRHSAGYALTAAIGAVALGGILPISGLSHAIGNRRVAIAADMLLLIGLALAISGRRAPRAVGGALAAATGLTLLLFNTSYPYNWSGLTILALMFTGTMLYRAERGEFGRVKAAVIAVVVFALAIAAGVWHSMMWHMNAADQRQFDLQWISCLVLAGGTFAVGMALRHRTVPRALAWLGLVSYSVYMLHPIVLNAYRSFSVFRGPTRSRSRFCWPRASWRSCWPARRSPTTSSSPRCSASATGSPACSRPGSAPMPSPRAFRCRTLRPCPPRRKRSPRRPVTRCGTALRATLAPTARPALTAMLARTARQFPRPRRPHAPRMPAG